MKEVVIVAAARTAGGKAPKGTLRDTRPEFLGKCCMEQVIKATGIDRSLIDDIIWGCSTPEQSMGMNIARLTSLYANIPISVPAVTVNRFCSSGLQAISFAAESIMSGRCDVVLAGGVEHMSMVQMGGVLRPNPEMLGHAEWGKAYTMMGITAENVARKYGIGREEQDQFALSSHQKAEKAVKEGRFKDEIAPVPVARRFLDEDGKNATEQSVFDTDEGIRSGLCIENLQKLAPAFMATGTVTAGNSSQTTDGASAVLLMSLERAKELGIRPELRYLGFSVAGCAPEEMGIGPILAVPKVLKLTGLSAKDIGLIELNEAFASQALYCIKKLELDPDTVNVNGGAIALGHPLGATGGKLTATLMHEMRRRKTRYGMVTMCVGGGQGAAGIYELM